MAAVDARFKSLIEIAKQQVKQSFAVRTDVAHAFRRSTEQINEPNCFTAEVAEAAESH
jgi:hypothetical protein